LSAEKQLAVISYWDTTFLDAAFAFQQMKEDIFKDLQLTQLNVQKDVF